MLDDADSNLPEFDPPDPDRVYFNYVETCRRLGVEPVAPDRVQELIAGWSDAIAAGRSAPPPTH